MSNIGRKTKLTPELQKKIIKCLKAGWYAKEACKAVGISQVTLYDWLKRGKKGEEPFLKFLKSVRQADAFGELKIFLEIRAQVKKDWRAGMEILARKYPKRWGKKDKLVPETPKQPLKTKHDIEAERAIEKFRREEKKLTPEQRKQLVQFAIKAEEEFMKSNANNGDGKH